MERKLEIIQRLDFKAKELAIRKAKLESLKAWQDYQESLADFDAQKKETFTALNANGITESIKGVFVSVTYVNAKGLNKEELEAWLMAQEMTLEDFEEPKPYFKATVK